MELFVKCRETARNLLVTSSEKIIFLTPILDFDIIPHHFITVFSKLIPNLFQEVRKTISKMWLVL